MKYVIGIDLGTSAVKVLLVNQYGRVCGEALQAYPLIHEKSGYSEQQPEEWIKKTTLALKELVAGFEGNINDIEGISFSGQMHGLVLLNEKREILRNAILWNDIRTTAQCERIYNVLGKEQLLQITKNPALEGFTLPKLLWVQENELDIFNNTHVFLLPKDYLRYRMTGQIHTEYSDAAGTLLLDVKEKLWSVEICNLFNINPRICPPLIESHDFIGTITSQFADETGLSKSTKVFAGGADNACGAIGAGILFEGKTLCSIGTSGVILSYEQCTDHELGDEVHCFNHGKENAFYTMGVTLSAGHSLSWFKETFAKGENFETLLHELESIPSGSHGLLYTPYLFGERTPYADADIRGSFIGIDASHKRIDFVRAVIEGVTFSLCETINIFRDGGKKIDSIISIGGGAKNDTWLQIQADIFNAVIMKLENEQGPSIGAAMLAAYGSGWFSSLEDCSNKFIRVATEFHPNKDNVKKYKVLFDIYKSIYTKTKDLNNILKIYRK
ncbi:xylulokinase [Peribacillus muralis]|uniref:xylulokinase n=1 Tax=Peribacillus muralis TaxID=264697 RepID=UPI00070C5982|nr:xylulokinase [Peribacillus muralis]